MRLDFLMIEQQYLSVIFPIIYHDNNIVLVSIWKEDFVEASNNLARYRSENNFVLIIKIIRTLKLTDKC